MAHKLLGNALFRVTTTPIAELGITVRDVRGGQGILTFTEFLPAVGGGLTQVVTTRRFDPEGEYKYVFASAGITEGNSVQLNVAASTATRHADVIHTTAVDQAIEGIALVTIPAGNYGWIQIAGKHYNANVLDAVADFAFLATSAVAGQMVDVGGAPTALNALIAAHGRRVRKMADATTQGGLADRGLVLIKG